MGGFAVGVAGAGVVAAGVLNISLDPFGYLMENTSVLLIV